VTDKPDHSMIHTHTHSVGLPEQGIGQSQQPLPDNTWKFKPPIPASVWQQTVMLHIKSIN